MNLESTGSHKVCAVSFACFWSAAFYLLNYNGSFGMSMCISIAQARTKRAPSFSRKFSHKSALAPCPCAFRLSRLAENLRLPLGLRPFTCIFLQKIALMTCPCAFRLRSLAHSVGRGFGIHLGHGIFSANVA